MCDESKIDTEIPVHPRVTHESQNIPAPEIPKRRARIQNIWQVYIYAAICIQRTRGGGIKKSSAAAAASGKKGGKKGTGAERTGSPGARARHARADRG